MDGCAAWARKSRLQHLRLLNATRIIFLAFMQCIESAHSKSPKGFPLQKEQYGKPLGDSVILAAYAVNPKTAKQAAED